MKNKLVLSMPNEAGNFDDGIGVKYYNNRKHAGVFKDKLENGIGITEWPSGAKVYGVFKDGTMDGLGLFITRTKLKYYGQIKDFKPSGGVGMEEVIGLVWEGGVNAGVSRQCP